MIWTILVTFHVVISLVLIVAILLQQGKGASMGILSGAGQTWFGPTGGKTLLMKITVGLACAFLLNSVLLSLAVQRQTTMALPPLAQAAPPPQGTPPPGAPAQSTPPPAPAPQETAPSP